jgi:hypothetical protein
MDKSAASAIACSVSKKPEKLRRDRTVSFATYWLVVPLIGGTLEWGIVAALWLAQRRHKAPKAAE